MPTRRITRSPVKVTGTVPDGQQFESTLEEDFFVLQRFNPLVASFEAQPVVVEWQDDNGKIRTYTPDVLVRYRNDLPESANWPPALCEIKPDLNEKSESPRRRKPPRKENERENALKWAAAERYAARQGWLFEVVRESQIRTPHLDNARFLLRHLERTAPSKHEQPLLAWLADHRSSALGDWAAILGSGLNARAAVLPACYRLIALRQVDVDLSVPLTLQSIVKALCDA
jgi:hypothetical protein